MSLLADRFWRQALALAALLLFAGGPLHPNPDTTRSFEQSTAAMLGTPSWVPAHALILAAYVAAAVGLSGLARRATSPAGRAAGWLAVAGALGSAVEMSFHLAAVVDRAALVSGGPTPILNTHLTLATFVQPLLGFSIAAYAVLETHRRDALGIALLGLGVVGGVLHGLSAPIVVATRDQGFSVLFKAAILIALWLALSAVASRRAPSRDREAATARAGATL